MLNKNSYWLKSGIYTILEKGLTLVFSFGSVFLLYRIFTLEEAGIWAQFLTITTLLELARNGLIQNGLIKFLTTSDKALYPRILTSSVVLNLILTFFSVLFLFTCSNVLSKFWHAPILEDMLYIYIFTTIILIPFYHFQFIEQANFSFKATFFSTLTRQGVFFIIIGFVFLNKIEVNLVDIAKIQIASIFFGSLVSYIMVKKFLQFQKTIDFQWVKKLFNYGRFVFGTNISGVVFSSIDQMMLGNIKGNEPVGLYNVAIRISNIVEVPTSSVAAIVFPESAKRMEKDGRGALKNLYEKSVGLILAMIVPMSFVILLIPEFLITLAAGEKYAGAVSILQITIFYTLIAPFTRQFGTIIDSMGNPKLNFYFTLGSASLNIVLNYFFINSFGILGAAYGTLVTYFAMFAFTQAVLSRMFKIKTLNVFINMINYYKEGFIFANGLRKKALR